MQSCHCIFTFIKSRAVADNKLKTIRAMFYQFYYVFRNNEHIYISALSVEKRVEVSIYKGAKLVERKSLLRGIHVLQHEDIVLKVELKMFKILPELTIGNEKIKIKKIKLKALKVILTEDNIYNEINPRSKPSVPYNYRKLISPIVLIILGIIIFILTENKSKFWSIPSILILIIAYFQLFSPLLNKVPQRHMDEDTRGKFKLLVAIGFMILTQIIVSELIN